MRNTKKAVLSKIKQFRNKAADKLNFPDGKTKYSTIIFIIVTISAFFISVNARYEQLSVWKSKPLSFFAGDTPMMSTLDAYKFIRHAKEHREGIYDTSVLDPQHFYPDSSPYPNPLPLLSLALDYISRVSGNDNIYETAINMTPWISSFFIVSAAIYFYLTGYAAIGIIAAFITAFSPMFYGRTSIGRFDTDGLNMFFLFTASVFVLLASRSQERKKIFIYSALSGVTIFLFYRFYHHGMFNIIYLVLLTVSLIIGRSGVKTAAIAAAIYCLFSSPLYMYYALDQLIHAVNVYIFQKKTGIEALFPNVYETISEAKRFSTDEILSCVIKNKGLALSGIAGAALFAVLNFKKALPLAPIALLGAMSFISAGRFTMFLAPVIGAGLGYMIYIMTGYASKALPPSKHASDIKSGMNFIAAALFLAIILLKGETSYGTVPAPSIHPKIWKFIEETGKELPKNSVIYTWWDYGLAITDITGFRVFHSGMSQETPKTWAIALSLLSDQKTLYNIVSYIDTFGIKEIETMAEKGADIQDITERITGYDKGASNDNIYILFTEDMASKYAAFGVLADIDAGYLTSPCIYHDEENMMICSELTIDITAGVINNKIPLQTLTVTENGKITANKVYSLKEGYRAIIEIIDGRAAARVMKSGDYNSSFVQMYFLNNYDDKYFSLVKDEYPYGRLYKLKKNAK